MDKKQLEVIDKLVTELKQVSGTPKLKTMVFTITQEFTWDFRNKKEVFAFAVYRKDPDKEDTRISNYFETQEEAMQMLEDYKKELIAAEKNKVVYTEDFQVEGEEV